MSVFKGTALNFMRQKVILSKSHILKCFWSDRRIQFSLKRALCEVHYVKCSAVSLPILKMLSIELCRHLAANVVIKCHQNHILRQFSCFHILSNVREMVFHACESFTFAVSRCENVRLFQWHYTFWMILVVVYDSFPFVCGCLFPT